MSNVSFFPWNWVDLYEPDADAGASSGKPLLGVRGISLRRGPVEDGAVVASLRVRADETSVRAVLFSPGSVEPLRGPMNPRSGALATHPC